MKRRSPTLDEQWNDVKRALDAAVAKHGARSIAANTELTKLNDITRRILRRDNRRRKSA